MCLVALAIEPRRAARADEDPIVFALAANRDEVLARPTAPLAAWSDAPNVYGGRDLDKGGTWLGVRTDGRFALVTNYRDFRRAKPTAPPSRGALTADFLRGDEPVESLLARLEREGDRFEPYNLVVGDLGARRLHWHSNVGGAPRALGKGHVHGLSNALLDTPWPKVRSLTTTLDHLLASTPTPYGARSPEGVVELVAEERLSSFERASIEALASRELAPVESLPDTGVPPDVERALSSAFVALPGYGTRCSSVLTLTRGGRLSFVERTYDAFGVPLATRLVELTLR